MKKLLVALGALALAALLSANAQSYPSGAVGPAKQHNLNPTTPEEQYRMAYNMWIGRRNVPVNHSESLKLLQRAAAGKHALAAHDYGVAVYWGLSVPANKVAGTSWVLRACVLAGVADTNAALAEVTGTNGVVQSPFNRNTQFGRLTRQAR